MTVEMPSRVFPSDVVQGDSEEDTAMLREMMEKARRYLSEFEWCDEVADLRFGCGVGGVVLVAAARISSRDANVEDWLWVVVGDLPSAYISARINRTSRDALSAYCESMARWIDAVRGGNLIENLFSVSVEPTQEHAEMLATRVEFLRTRILPYVDT